MPELALSEVRSIPSPSSPEPPRTTASAVNDLKVENIRKTLQKRYQSLALIATFLCGVEAQIITYTLDDGDKDSHAYQAFNSLLLVAMILSMFGAITATMTMRFYSIVPKNSLKPLTQRHSSDHGQLASFALSSSEYLTSAGSSIFVAGLLTYTWLRQEHPVAILASVAAVCGVSCVCLIIDVRQRSLLVSDSGHPGRQRPKDPET